MQSVVCPRILSGRSGPGGLSYVTGYRGSRKLQVGQFSFTKNKVAGNRTYWSCARAYHSKCKARVMTVLQDGKAKTITRGSEHNHPPH